MLPMHMRPEKTFCRGQLFWESTGHSSLATVIQGKESNLMPCAIDKGTITTKEMFCLSLWGQKMKFRRTSTPECFFVHR